MASGGLTAIDKKMRAPYPPLWQEHNDPRGELALVYSVPGSFVPPRPGMAPLLTASDEDVSGPMSPFRFTRSWDTTAASFPMDVQTFHESFLTGQEVGIAFYRDEKWSLGAIRSYFDLPRNADAEGIPIPGTSQMPIVAGPFTSDFRPRCVSSLDDFPDLDRAAMVAGERADVFFKSHRILGLSWGNTPWLSNKYSRWIMVEEGSVNVLVAHDLTRAERQAFDVFGRDYPASSDLDKVKTMPMLSRSIMFLPPGCRYKVTFYQDTLLSVGDIAMQHRKNPLPKLPTRYDVNGYTYEDDMDREHALEVCMRGYESDE